MKNFITFIMLIYSVSIWSQKSAPIAGDAAKLIDLLHKDYQTVNLETFQEDIARDRSQVIAIFKTYLGDIYRPDSHTYSNSPELRSMPDYYQMKYSINPKLAGVAGSEIKKKINYRLWDNIYFGVGFSNENVDIPDDLAYGGVSELWEKS